jgi:septum site-determining protein MinC
MKSMDTPNESSVFELKGSVLTIIVLHIKETCADRLYPQLTKKFNQARSFFKSAPILLDLSEIPEGNQADLNFVVLAETLRKLGLVPVGVRGSASDLSERILQAGLGLLPAIKSQRSIENSTDKDCTEPDLTASSQQPKTTEAETDTVQTVTSTKVITQPIRSGQQVIAREGDLVVLSSVNAGAEVLAAGNIHVYGALRGRAMAGINGDTTARVFSLQCNPELVAIAGEYLVNDLLAETVINQSVIVSLENGSLNFQVVGSFNAFT